MQASEAFASDGGGSLRRTVLEGEHPPLADLVFEVLDFSPDWDWAAGNAKLLLTGSILPGAVGDAHHRSLFIKFDDVEVSAAG